MKIHYLLIAAIALTALIGCKTTEENYRRAYERSQKSESADIDSTIYGRIRQEASEELYTIGGDTVNLRREYVALTNGQEGIPANAIKRYCVVAAQFKQLFHAKSACTRFKDAGYPGAFIVETREPLYYVVIATTADVTEAREQLLKVEQNPPFKLQDRMPFILRSPNR